MASLLSQVSFHREADANADPHSDMQSTKTLDAQLQGLGQ